MLSRNATYDRVQPGVEHRGHVPRDGQDGEAPPAVRERQGQEQRRWADDEQQLHPETGLVLVAGQDASHDGRGEDVPERRRDSEAGRGRGCPPHPGDSAQGVDVGLADRIADLR